MAPIHALFRSSTSRGRASLESQPNMDRYRAPKARPDQADADDSDELGVFAAERYFYGDDDELWPCERSSSSLSSAFRTGTHEPDRSVPTPTAVTSSSEASWNSRSTLLPNPNGQAEKLHAAAAAAAAAAATPIIESRPSGAEGQRPGRRPASSSNLRRWLRGVAACACAGGASEDTASADEIGTNERFPETEVPEVTAARSSLTPASGRWLLGGDNTTLAGMEAFSSPNPIQPAGDGHRRATDLGELSTPILHPQAAATSHSDERRRIKPLETFWPVPPVGDHGSSLGSEMQRSSASAVVAGNTALGGDAQRAASGGGGSPGEDDAAPSELGCQYPPSEASVVWSVVTADGAASGIFSSGASGYYYHYCLNDLDHGAMRGAGARNTRRRRSGIVSSSSLLCMSEKAVDAVGPTRSVHRQ
ncbi:hypothetical protein ZEAMMB73_Zm00001d037834 [Zea mays]|uniref:Uncharacterized protein n=2 Tax=Zea mays TaxID=4577 RepID=A0A1D6M0W9_MAIZE|nr:hypothetical protein ZEAMMB73_Zm00001d037834 [Zea mays]